MESKDSHAMDGDFDEDAEAFEALEKDFQEVLENMVGDKTLESFRSEYVKLHEALKKVSPCFFLALEAVCTSGSVACQPFHAHTT